MIGANLHGLRPVSSTPAFSGFSLAPPRRRPSSSVVVRPAIPITRSAVVVASAKKFSGRYRRRPRFDRSLLDEAEGEDESGSLEVPAPFALTSQSPPDDRDDSSSRAPKLGPPASEPSPKKQSPLEGKKKEQVEEAPLRGMDVLLALKNAAARKNSQRGKARRAGTKSGGEPEQDGDDGEVEARPLEIKEDWMPRLEELEKAVEEIKQQQLGDSM